MRVPAVSADSSTSVDEDKKLIEMTLRKKPSTNGPKKSIRKGLPDLEVGQKVLATVKKVSVNKIAYIFVRTKRLVQVETYGMFLRIDDSDVSGLCHRSEVRCIRFYKCRLNAPRCRTIRSKTSHRP